MKSIEFKGKTIRYKNLGDLASQLNISKQQASQYVKDDGRRIIFDPNGNTALVNMKKDNFNGLLKENFNTAFVRTQSIVKGQHDTKKIYIRKKVTGTDRIKVGVSVFMYISFSSEPPNPRRFLKDKYLTLSKKKQRELLYGKPGDGYDMFRYHRVLKLKKVRDYYNNGPYEIGNLYRAEKFELFHGFPDEILPFIRDRIVRPYMDECDDLAQLYSFAYAVRDTYTRQKLRLKDGVLSDMQPLRLCDWVNLEYESTDGDDTCCVNFIAKRYPKFYNDIKAIENDRGVIYNKFMKFCKDRKISYIFYDQLGEILHEFTSDDDKMGTIYAIVANNHIYPTSGGKPLRVKKNDDYAIKFVNNSCKNFKKILDKGITPANINITVKHDDLDNKIINDVLIVSCVVDNTKYICNPEYRECLDFLTAIGKEEYIYDDIKITHLPSLMEKIYRAPNINSFYPEIHLLKQKAIIYEADDIEECENLKSIDAVKFYTSLLYGLPYLMMSDYRTDPINKNITEIVDSNMYWAEPEYKTTLAHGTELYPGYYLRECIEIGLKFKILEEIVCEHEPNYFYTIIPKLKEHLENDKFKNAMNTFIGTFESGIKYKTNYKYKGIFTDEALQYENGFTNKIGDHTLLFDCKETITNVRSRIMVAVQIKCASRMAIYKMTVKELKLKDHQIKQIKTDAVTYDSDKYPTNLGSDKLGGWKKAEVKIIGMGKKIACNKNYGMSYEKARHPSEDHLDDLDPSCRVKNKNILYTQYAGCGKTTKILTEIIPKLEKKNKTFIVLAVAHSMLDDYKKANINCNVVATYTFSNTIPEEDVIIFDEVGFMGGDGHDLLFKIMYAGKKYICFGDFNQLQPVGEKKPYNQPHYLNYMFGTIITEFTNFRNNFTKKYYDGIINGHGKYLIKQINKYSVGIDETDNVLCYRHETKDKYNKIILKKKGFKTMNEVGVKIVCKTNDLLDREDNNGEKDGLYNNKFLTIIGEEDEAYTLEDENNSLFIVDKKELFRYFELGYVVNIHQAQGKTLDSYHWLEEDNIFVTGSVAYTIISRLLQELTDEKIDK